MKNSEVITTELVVAGFKDKNTAFLARAALARLQHEWGMATDDVAIVLRETDGQVALEQVQNRSTGRDQSSTFWEMFTDLFFVPESLAGTATEAGLEKFVAVGIDADFTSRAVIRLRPYKSALLVRTRGLVQREKIVGVMQGFNGELMRVPLGS